MASFGRTVLLLLPLVQGASTLETAKDGPPEGGDPKYQVQLMAGALPSSVVASKPGKSVVMTKKNGKKYRCYLPGAPNSTKPEKAADPLTTPHVASFLHQLKGKCFYRLDGWWTYEFCFMNSVRQFHQEKSKAIGAQAKSGVTASPLAGQISQDYKLGLYWWPDKKGAGVEASTGSGEIAEAKRKDGEALLGDGGSESNHGKVAAGGVAKDSVDYNFRGEMGEDAKTKRKYWKQIFGNGTHCDLTGKPREAEVRLHCAPGEPSYLASVEETETCRYLVQFSCNLLCKHPAFVVDKEKETTESIQCEPIDAKGVPMPPPPPPPKAEKGATVTDDGGIAAAASEGGAGKLATASAQSELRQPQGEEPLRPGDCIVHLRHNYRGVILSADKTCQQSESWIRANQIDMLQGGRAQPFYHVLVDLRDRPSASAKNTPLLGASQMTYVAHENLLLDTPAEPLQNPLVEQMFSGFDAAHGRFTPNPSLDANLSPEAESDGVVQD